MGIHLEVPEPTYNTTLSSVWRCDSHILWCTKYRRSVLTEPIQQRMKALIYQQQDAYAYRVTPIEIMPDPVHLLASIAPQDSVTKVVGRIKGFCARVLRDEKTEIAYFGIPK